MIDSPTQMPQESPAQTPREATPRTSETPAQTLKMQKIKIKKVLPKTKDIPGYEATPRTSEAPAAQTSQALPLLAPSPPEDTNFDNGANHTKAEAAELEADFQDGRTIKGAALLNHQPEDTNFDNGANHTKAEAADLEADFQDGRKIKGALLNHQGIPTCQDEDVCENPALSAGVVSPPPPPLVSCRRYLQPMVAVPQVVIPAIYTTLEMDPLCEGCGMADPNACFLATCCPCMAVGEIAEAVDMDYSDACCAYAAMCVFCGPECADCVHGCGLAQRLRQRYDVNTHENGCVTCCCHCVTDPKNCLMGRWNLFCCSFALTQELRFARKVKANQSPIMAGPVRQMMLPNRISL